MKLLYKPLILLIVSLFSQSAFAQKQDSTWVGTAEGIVRDSVHNYVLQSATLAVYKVEDSSLVSYQLTNNFGEFHFKGLPVGIPLRIIVSYTGYTSMVRKFAISLKNKGINFKNINLERGENNLEEVIVDFIPPVTMNGDTLEFNAAAFKMDPNAVTEDLLRKLPGVMVWGDGSITVNGKEVSSVLVNGKPFFGGDTKVASQNLPKTAVDKIQVYQQSKDQNNPLDSITQINIKLKKNKSFGHFGKVAAGYGTDEHYETDANLNFFSNRTQIGIVGASNNINKVANNANTLMSNSTYTGVAASIEYQPDFNMQGINQPNAGGFTFQHDFIPDPNNYNNNRLAGNYFINNNTNQTNRNTQTITSLGKDSTQTQEDNSTTKITNTGQSSSAKYDKLKDNNAYHIGAGFNTNSSSNNSTQQNSVSSFSQDLLSTNDIESSSHNNSKNVALEASLRHNKAHSPFNKAPGNWDAEYSFNAGNGSSIRENKSDFISLYDPSQNRSIDRLYDNSNNDTKQHLSLSLGNFSNWILPPSFRSIDVTLQNNIDINTRSQNHSVQDKDTATGVFVANHYLSGSSNYVTINELPALNLSKNYFKVLANRYQKSFSINLNAQGQFYYQKNNSSHSFQNIAQNYQKFVPTANINYTNYQYGEFQDNYNLHFAVSSDYPTIDQLVPLIDSSNLYYIQEGNVRLKPTDTRQLTFSVQHNSYRAKNTFNYNLNISAGITNNSFADSSTTDTIGRSSHYVVNVDGNKFLNNSLTLKKAYKFRSNQLQISLNTTLNLSKNPSYINKTLNWSNSLYNNNVLKLFYTFKDKMAIDLQEGYALYHSQQSGANDNVFKNNIQYTKFSASINLTKKLTLRSNVTYNHATSSGSPATNFTIWNANTSYRFLKGNNLELKFSAMDLLHQNTSIINYGSNNTLTHGRVNVLQQYFMFTLSYFPRRFGKKEKNHER